MSTVPAALGAGAGGGGRPTRPDLAGPGSRHRAPPHEGPGAVAVAASSSAGDCAHPRAGPPATGDWVPPSPATRPASAPSGMSPKDTQNSKQCRASNHYLLHCPSDLVVRLCASDAARVRVPFKPAPRNWIIPSVYKVYTRYICIYQVYQVYIFQTRIFQTRIRHAGDEVRPHTYGPSPSRMSFIEQIRRDEGRETPTARWRMK